MAFPFSITSVPLHTLYRHLPFTTHFQNNYFWIQHCHFVNSTQISDVIKRLRFGKSDGIDNLYSDNFKHGTGYFSIVFQLLLIVFYVMDMHPPVFSCCCYTNFQER